MRKQGRRNAQNQKRLVDQLEELGRNGVVETDAVAMKDDRKQKYSESDVDVFGGGEEEIEKPVIKRRKKGDAPAGFPLWREDTTEVLNKGKFTDDERKLVVQAIYQVLEEEGVQGTEEELIKNVNYGQKDGIKDFWPRVTLLIPNRSILAVYRHCKRRWGEGNHKGDWTEDEIQELRRLVKLRGSKWTQIGQELGRLPGACKDKWRDHVRFEGSRKVGRTTREENEKLTDLIRKAVGDKPTDENLTALPWTAISREMGSRSYLQCLNSGRAIIKSLNKKIESAT